MEIVKSMIMAGIFLMTAGVISLKKPEIVGIDFYLDKYKWIYIPKYRKCVNKQYEHQIKVIGIGLIMSALILFASSVIYIAYPYILLLFK